jgi:hypothetical protein
VTLARRITRATGSGLRPNRLYIYEDRIEDVNPGVARRQSHQVIRYPQVAQVAAKKGLAWSSLIIETVGGGSITVKGLPWELAEPARIEIDQRVGKAWRTPTSAQAAEPTVAASGLADELARLGELRASGVPSEEEFASAKRALLGMKDPSSGSHIAVAGRTARTKIRSKKRSEERSGRNGARSHTPLVCDSRVSSHALMRAASSDGRSGRQQGSWPSSRKMSTASR